ncbi:peptidoglycan-binding protein [Streptomyces sp. NBC_00322]|uniref:peptidoglycan-binding protein n=1 Tax=Streptomyces sp. NBC_00322 TaxID=2975712 RepID=UPI002E2E670D|nr:peptidoglycan-binding protein [Streptomyces sp. NBC_00322]
MTAPVFEEFEPTADCDCAGCAQQRRALAAGEHPAAHGCRRALVLFTAAGVVLGGGGGGAAAATGTATPVGVASAPASAPGAAASVDDPESTHEQGGTAPLHGPSGRPTTATASAPLRPVTRAEIINRAKQWVAAKVPYSMDQYWSDGYRQDCSGYVSMAWNMGSNEWTGSLAQFATRITREELEPGDILLFHNPDNPTTGSHVTIFGGWTDYTHTYYVAYEQTKPHTRKQPTPMGYWTNADRYLPYRYNGLITGTTTASGPVSADEYPGATAFGPGANNAYITKLGEMLAERGGKHFYTKGPGPVWGEADRRATEAFQLAQGWRGPAADGMPSAQTWQLLATKQGTSIPEAAPGPGGTSAAKPMYPGSRHFRPGRSSAHVTQLGRKLVELGFGKHYTAAPGPVWDEADRRNVEAFQRAQGWRGAAADGFPGPETWRRLFA